MDSNYSAMENTTTSSPLGGGSGHSGGAHHMTTVPEEEKLEESGSSAFSFPLQEPSNPYGYGQHHSDSPLGGSAQSSSQSQGGQQQQRKPPSVLDEMMEAMALSFLIFLIADMRLMSATGRVMTKYEIIAVESDYVVRDTAAILAGNIEHLPSAGDGRDRSLSPAQMFTTVLIELRKTMDRKPTKEDRFKTTSFGMLRSTAAAATTPKEGTAQDSLLSTSAPSGKGGHKLNENMHSLLKAYAQMVGNDLAEVVPHIEKRRSMINLMQSQRIITNRPASGTGSGAVGTGTGSGRQGNVRQKIAMRLSVMHKDVSHQMYHTAQNAMLNLPEAENTKTVRELKETTDTLFQMGMAENKHENLRSSLSSGMGSVKYLTPDELLKVMENAVKSRVRGKLDFMSQFFRDGTLSQLMIRSNIRIVWVNDWYPVKDLVYAIGIDEEKHRVLVVFRGAITKQDWTKAISSQFSQAPNPIEEFFEDKSQIIDPHRGFYEYLFRVRKDTGTTKFDEIAEIAHKYGSERLGPDYKLAVVGHSLGAALSTVFGFWASADKRFTNSGPVNIFNFGSPMVGGQLFADSFRHQEKTGKLRLVRFYNHNDVVARAPFNVKFNKRGINFRHVGVGVEVPPLPMGCCKQKTWDPNVFWIGRETFWASYCRGISQHMFLHAPWIWEVPKMHTLAELLQRVMEGRERLNSLETEFSLLQLPIEALYKELMD